jgi:hypothetical protein
MSPEPAKLPSPAPRAATNRSTSIVLALLVALGAFYLSRMVAPAALFQPIKVGSVALKHRVVLAPLTRYRANVSHVPLDIVSTYYEQRGSTPGA